MLKKISQILYININDKYPVQPSMDPVKTSPTTLTLSPENKWIPPVETTTGPSRVSRGNAGRIFWTLPISSRENTVRMTSWLKPNVSESVRDAHQWITLSRDQLKSTQFSPTSIYVVFSLSLSSKWAVWPEFSSLCIGPNTPALVPWWDELLSVIQGDHEMKSLRQ